MPEQQRYIHEYAGVYFEVVYEINANPGVGFHSVRTLDADHRPTGPDLLDWLRYMTPITQNPETAGTSYLEFIAQEILDERNGTGRLGRPLVAD